MAETEQELLNLIFQLFGKPVGEALQEFKRLPRWHAGWETIEGAMDSVRILEDSLGYYGKDLAMQMLQFAARNRRPAVQLKEHAYFYPSTVGRFAEDPAGGREVDSQGLQELEASLDQACRVWAPIFGTYFSNEFAVVLFDSRPNFATHPETTDFHRPGVKFDRTLRLWFAVPLFLLLLLRCAQALLWCPRMSTTTGSRFQVRTAKVQV
jgi:hypothetical protein